MELVAPGAPERHVRFRPRAAHGRVGQQPEHVLPIKTGQRQAQKQFDGFGDAALAGQPAVDGVHGDSVKSREDGFDVREIRVDRAVRDNDRDLVESEPGRTEARFALTDERPDRAGDDLNLAPDARTGEEPDAAVVLAAFTRLDERPLGRPQQDVAADRLQQGVRGRIVLHEEGSGLRAACRLEQSDVLPHRTGP